MQSKKYPKHLKKSLRKDGKEGSPKLPVGLENLIIDIDGVVCEDIPNEQSEKMITAAEIPGTKEQINNALIKASKTPRFKGILMCTTEPLVSSDYVGNSYSSIVDLELTNVVGGNLVKVVAWYDNEMGYSHRLVEMVGLFAK